MAKGKLTVSEKYTIQGMLHAKQSTAAMAKTLGRKKDVVEHYINTELEDLASTIAKVQLSDDDGDEADDNFQAHVPSEMYNNAKLRLIQGGVDRAKAEEMLKRVVRKLDFDPDNEQQLYKIALNSLNAHDTMVTQAAGGRKGVTAMTKAASERAEANQVKHVGKSNVRGNRLWQPKEGKMK